MQGIRTSEFGALFTGELIQSRAFSPTGSSAQSEDSKGDVLCEAVFGEYTPLEETFKFCRGSSMDTSVKLGQVEGNYVIKKITATRNNKDALTVAVLGIPVGSVGDTATLPQYTIPWPTGYSAGGNGAVAAGFTVSAGRVISSSLTAEIKDNPVADSKGDIACMGFFGGRVESNNEVQSCDTAPAAAVTGDWTASPGSGAAKEGNTEYETKTFQAFINIVRD
jgi:hypothetical protein